MAGDPGLTVHNAFDHRLVRDSSSRSSFETKIALTRVEALWQDAG